MRKVSKMPPFIALFIVLFAAACKKNTVPQQSKTETSTTLPVTTPVAPTAPVAVTPSYEVGTGSGYLTIDGKSMDLTAIKLIKIKAGAYRGITIKNISATAAQPVSIKNNGQISITESMQTENVNNVIIAGDNISGITYGFLFENISYRAISLNGKMSGVTLKSMKFKNVSDYVISGNSGNDSGLKYDGSSETRTENFKILNCDFDNSGSISFGGNLNGSEDSGFFKDVEIAYCSFENTNAGTVCSFTNVQDYNIHHNVVNNLNQTNNDHNGIFFMQGNGKFHDNKLTNYQGNSIRMWLYSRGSTPATNEIYNNICYNTRKYSGFELQGFSRNLVSGKTTFANAKVYNNTVGKMNTSKDWEGQVLDVYNYGGTLEYYNNLGFELNGSKSITNMLNNMSDTKILKEENNKYFSQQSSAVANTSTFNSLTAGLGASGI
ncbi:MAG: hypothetical protein EOO43_11465 [Flavobacterium sp.]|nr:MAG: hypothetical protein EOO43_11465 [Flavobacterium sp.]